MSHILSSQDVRIAQEPASIGARLVALILDGMIYGVYYYLLAMLGTLGLLDEANTYTLFILFLLPFFYTLICETMMSGQTLGKWIMHIRVVSLDGGGPSLLSFFLRWLMLPFDLLFSLGLGELCIFFTERQQRLGDLIAGTWVVKTQTYQNEMFTLNGYSLDEKYTIRYPKAINLTPAQAATIHDVLMNRFSMSVRQASHSLVPKVEAIVGKHRDEHNDVDSYLSAVLRDYRGSATSSSKKR